MTKLIIQIPYDGLGDHLFFSHIPRLARESKRYDQVFISSRNSYRYPDIRRLVWELNPYVSGFIDEPGTILLRSYVDLGPISKRDRASNMLDDIAIFYGLDDGTRGREPEIYYKPTIIPKLQAATVYDPNYVTNVGSVSRWGVAKFIWQEKLLVHYQLAQRGYEHCCLPWHVEELESQSLEEYCNIIVSCSHFLCFTSGGATLAAALNKPCTALYGAGQRADFRHSSLHQYVNCQDILPSFTQLKSRLTNFLPACPRCTKPLIRRVLRISSRAPFD